MSTTGSEAGAVPAPSPAGSGGTLGAMVICLIGAVLVFLQSIWLVIVGTFYQAPTWGFLGLTIGELGGLGILVAIVLVVLSVLVYAAPRHHLVLGVGMLTFALLSLYSGGGAILGFLLCYVASLVAIFARPPNVVRAVSPELLAEARTDPVVEAELIDSGYAPSSGPTSDSGPR